MRPACHRKHPPACLRNCFPSNPRGCAVERFLCGGIRNEIRGRDGEDWPSAVEKFSIFRYGRRCRAGSGKVALASRLCLAMSWKTHRQDKAPCTCTVEVRGVKIPNPTGGRRPFPPLAGAAAPDCEKIPIRGYGAAGRGCADFSAPGGGFLRPKQPKPKTSNMKKITSLFAFAVVGLGIQTASANLLYDGNF